MGAARDDGSKDKHPGGSGSSGGGAAAGEGGAGASYGVTVAWVATWIVISVSIIIVNKYVMSHSGFHFPFTLAVWHMALATVTARTAVWALHMPDTIRQHGSQQLYFHVAMIGVLFGGALVTGNWALLYLTVPTVQMLKASGPAVIYVIGIVMGNEQLGLMQSVKVLVVCFGVGVASYGDLTLSAAGFALQVVSIAADATRCCSLQRVMQANHIDAGPLVTLAYVAPCAMAALVLPAALLEGPRLLAEWDSWRGGAPMVLLSGVLASLLNLVVFKIIRLTSALTTSLTGVIKEWACILVAMYVYSTVVTRLQWLGYGIAIAGLLWYQSGRIKAAQARLACGQPLIRAKDEEEGDVVVCIHATGSRVSAADGGRVSSWGQEDDAYAVLSPGAGGRSSHSGHVPLLRVKV